MKQGQAWWWFAVLALAAAACAADEAPDESESFDLGGLAKHPKQMAVARLRETISERQPGDLAAAARVQRDLAALYREARDEARAATAEARFRQAVAAACPGLRGTGAEAFDLSGLPVIATTMEIQTLWEALQGHQPGDLRDAARLQERLAAFYRDAKDDARAAVADERAKLARATPAAPVAASAPVAGAAPTPGAPPAGGAAATSAPAAPGAPMPPSTASTPPAPATALVGRYYLKAGALLDKWDFNADGSFYHATIAGTVRTGERGTFKIVGDTLELTIARETTAFNAPGERPGETVLGAGTDPTPQTRRLKLKLLGPAGKDGVQLDDATFKPRPWE